MYLNASHAHSAGSACGSRVGEVWGSRVVEPAHRPQAVGMHSMTIVEQRCPRCSNRRTVHLGNSRDRFCFNCRLRWCDVGGNSPADIFTEAERARLGVYRAAVANGFYSDWR
jgi:hypothetical protein